LKWLKWFKIGVFLYSDFSKRRYEKTSDLNHFNHFNHQQRQKRHCTRVCSTLFTVLTPQKLPSGSNSPLKTPLNDHSQSEILNSAVYAPNAQFPARLLAGRTPFFPTTDVQTRRPLPFAAMFVNTGYGIASKQSIRYEMLLIEVLLHGTRNLERCNDVRTIFEPGHVPQRKRLLRAALPG
jgi:hypothetical protein